MLSNYPNRSKAHPTQAMSYLYPKQTHQTSKSMLVGCFAERRKEGGQRPGDSRAAEQHAGMVLHKS